MIRNALIALAMALVVSTTSAENKITSTEEKLVNQHQGDGYSIRYPLGWRVADRPAAAVRGETDVMLVKGLLGSPNLGVSFESEKFPLKDGIRPEDKDEYARMVSAYLKAGGGRVENLVARDESLNGFPAISVQFDMTFMGKSVTQKQYLLPKDGRTYCITCTCLKGTYRQHEKTLHAIASSIEQSAYGSMPQWLFLTLVGVAVTMLVVLVGKLLTRSPAPATEPSYRI